MRIDGASFPAATPRISDVRAGSAPAAASEPIRSHWPRHSDDEIEAVAAVLRSGKVNALHHGEQTRAFERGFAERCGARHAIALANGTLALELALRALCIGPGDEVIVPARSFMASASCIVAVGADPVFVDVDEESQTLNAHTIARSLTSRTRAIIVVHLAGWPAPMDEIMALARSFDLVVIEDCAQAHGAACNGHPVGALGDAAAFSFCTDKIMSTGGEGGMLVLHDDAAWERAWAYKDHGKSPRPDGAPATPGAFRWLHESLGSNYRATEMQAAIGLCQLAKLDGWIAARQRNAEHLNVALAPLRALRRTVPPPHLHHAYYKYYVFVRPERLVPGWTRDRILSACHALGVPCGSGSCPELYREAAFAGQACVPRNRLPVAQKLGETSLMLPIDPTLTDEAVMKMAEGLTAVISAATD